MAKKKILVIEDDRIILQMIKDLLTLEGYAVLTAGSSEKGQFVLEEHPDIDLIISDVCLPGISGPKFFDNLERRKIKVKKILMSGDQQETNGIPFLHKPFEIEELSRVIRKTLGE